MRERSAKSTSIRRVGRMAVFLAALAIAATPYAASSAPRLSVEPDRGPVGTTVTIVAKDCIDRGNLTVAFQGEPDVYGSPVEGAVQLPSAPASDDPITLRFVIPKTLRPLQGSGGGPVRPGTYRFQTHPPSCSAEFTVTAGLAKTGSANTPPLAVASLMLGAGVSMIAMAAARKRCARTAR